jgi:hypothetical protein
MAREARHLRVLRVFAAAACALALFSLAAVLAVRHIGAADDRLAAVPAAGTTEVHPVTPPARAQSEIEELAALTARLELDYIALQLAETEVVPQGDPVAVAQVLAANGIDAAEFYVD